MEEEVVSSGQKAKKDKVKDKGAIVKESFNMIRTIYRNNIDLTNIADNKANILLSLNSLMLTFLIPIVLSNLTIIMELNLYLPLIVLSSSCITTIIMAAMATRPIKMGQQVSRAGDLTKSSPFFFGNYYKMAMNDYMLLIENTIMDPLVTKEYIKLDLYFMGKGLGEKYAKIRNCYSVFIGGLVLTVLTTVFVLVL